MDFSLFSMAPDETVQLKYVEEARRENGGKGAKRSRPSMPAYMPGEKRPVYKRRRTIHYDTC
jgi:hypothetical protein